MPALRSAHLRANGVVRDHAATINTIVRLLPPTARHHNEHDASTMTDVFDDVKFELIRARSKFPPFNSAHEGWAVLDEECEELKREVYWGVPAERMTRVRAEAVQVAAMAIRLIQDICDAPVPASRIGETHER